MFLDEEVNAFHREDYYLAQIAAEIRSGYVKNPNSVKISQFLLEFTSSQPQKEKSREEYLKQSKSAWLGAVGIKQEGEE